MKIDQQILKYLKGEEFSNSLSVDIGNTKHEAISREDAITEIIKNCDVIHIGCSDHIPLIREKIAHNTWLHKLITDKSNNCIGIDIDLESIDFLKKELGYNNVLHGNILTDDFQEISGKKWDYVVFGEIIEHLDNPVDFLRIFRTRYGSNVKRFVISVPSIYNRKQIRNMLNYKEIINSDHRFWFTPYTITKLIVSAGLNPEIISYANLNSLGKMGLIIRKLKRLFNLREIFPFYCFKTIIVTGTIN
jgi:hypothetical protein